MAKFNKLLLKSERFGVANPAELKEIEDHLQQLPKLLGRQSGVANNACHGVSVDGVVSRNRQDLLTISHDDVFALPQNPKTGALKRTNRVQMRNSGKFSH